MLNSDSNLKQQTYWLLNPEKLKEKGRSPWMRALMAIEKFKILIFLPPFGVYFLSPSWGIMGVAGCIIVMTLPLFIVGAEVFGFMQKMVFKKLGLNTSAELLIFNFTNENKLELIKKLEAMQEDFDPKIYHQLLSILSNSPNSRLWWAHFEGMLRVMEKEFKEKRDLLEDQDLKDDLQDQINHLKSVALEDQNKGIAFESSILSTDKLAPLSPSRINKG